MLDASKQYTADDLALLDDGTLDTLIELPDGTVWRYNDASDYRDCDGVLDFERFVRDIVLPDMDADLDLWS